MRSRFFRIILSITSLFYFSCKEKADSDLNAALARLALQANYVTISGAARGPGVLKNAQVDVIALPADGSCVNSSGKANGSSVGSTKTDSSGNYTVTYPRRSGLVCVVVTPTDGTTMTVSYASKKDVSWPGKVNMTGIIREPVQKVNSITGKDITPPKKANITPFTRMVASRFGGARRIQARMLENNLFLKAIHAVSPKSVTKTNEEMLDEAYTAAGNSFFRGLNTKSFKMEEANPDSQAYSLRLGGLTVKSESVGISSTKSRKLARNYTRATYNGDNISGDSIENLMSYMENDFSDGSFDGKKINSSGSTESMSSTELSQVGLTSKSADTFLKSELTSNIKEFAKLDPDVNENAYRSVQFCDPDDQTCEELAGDSAVFTYPEDGETNVSPYPFFLVSFIEEVNTDTLIVQDTEGACTGTIQISDDDFQTCMGGTLDKGDPYFTMFFGNDSNDFKTNTTYKIKVTTSVRNIEGNPILTANYQHGTGFGVADYYFTLSGGGIADSNYSIVWNTTINYSSPKYCSNANNDCNNGFDEGSLSGEFLNSASSDIYTYCSILTTHGLTWRVPHYWELESLFLGKTLNESLFSYVFTVNYWSADSFDETNAWVYDMNGGNSSSTQKNSSGIYAICVSDDYPY